MRAGATVKFTAHGNSMSPRIRDGDMVCVRPTQIAEVEQGDIVLAKVKGRWYLHLVSASSGDRVLITNNHGRTNGWTQNVVGVLVE